MAPRTIETNPLRQTAVKMRRQGIPLSVIARTLDMSVSRARRLSAEQSWIDNEREVSRRYKKSLAGTCVDCGGPTSYAGKDGKISSPRCVTCARKLMTKRRKWTRDTVVAAIQDFAKRNGRPPKATEWINSNPELGYPPRSAVYGTERAPFRSWREAIETAGYRTYKTPVRIDYGRVLDRLERGWTQKEIAEEQGCSIAAIALIVSKFRKQGAIA